MKRLKPEKLHVRFTSPATPEGPLFPRKYTLTHSDRTGDLYLTVGTDFDRKQISGWYARLLRDEALGEWLTDRKGHTLHIYVHVSGGIAIGTARWRSGILHREMPLVLEAIRYAEQHLVELFPRLDSAPVTVHFQSNFKKYNTVEAWGSFGDYRP
ncbi:staygreen family protein [Alicyclobacillus sp. ALC3]|uniref:staygreen family protein n=1 Tax=Alicyclobacillus sp. ALC3 TaxID=2796143 RepID=UPI002379A654|nr:staygreen family protein [Alicyclobacillus sp. ALC3]WDL95685.1 staygreen family protein [Alicyclobacillus sp. ALC3]